MRFQDEESAYYSLSRYSYPRTYEHCIVEWNNRSVGARALTRQRGLYSRAQIIGQSKDSSLLRQGA